MKGLPSDQIVNARIPSLIPEQQTPFPQLQIIGLYRTFSTPLLTIENISGSALQGSSLTRDDPAIVDTVLGLNSIPSMLAYTAQILL